MSLSIVLYKNQKNVWKNKLYTKLAEKDQRLKHYIDISSGEKNVTRSTIKKHCIETLQTTVASEITIIRCHQNYKVIVQQTSL